MTEDRKWEEINRKKREEIAYAQSFNLAVAMLSEKDKTTLRAEKLEIVEEWQELFYFKLTNNPRKEKLQAKKELAEKKKQEFVAELEI